MSVNRERWGTRVGLILAMAGNAVGLGNFLRFPVQAVQNGGGAFIIPYIVCFILMGIPLLWMEWSIGRFGGRNNSHATPFMLHHIKKGFIWKYVGVFGIFANIAVGAYYCYIESWTLSYLWHSIVQSFHGMDQAQVAGFFNDYVDLGLSTTGLPYEAIIFYVFCVVLNSFILSRGLKGGVEKVALLGMPLLLLFGVFLALRGLTLGSGGAPVGCADCNAFLGLNYLWQPDFSSLAEPKVWLAAAGQIFFTLSVGMGTIHCYASYVRANEDIALNAMSAGWMNSFVEIVLGASIVIPISVGYLGLDWVLQNAGFNMAFQTMPYLFQQWGPVLSTLGGISWFGLLFFAGITSSLAFGTPWMSFLEDEFDVKRKKAAWSFGLIVLVFGLPTVFFYSQGVFEEYDYWAGTVSLFIFALVESLLFMWWGRSGGWAELNKGADLHIPVFFRFIMRFVTPVLLLFVFITALITPVNNDWAMGWSRLKNEKTWELDPNSIIGKIFNKGLNVNSRYFAGHFESEVEGIITGIRDQGTGGFLVSIGKPVDPGSVQITGPGRPDRGSSSGQILPDSVVLIKQYAFGPKTLVGVEIGDKVGPGTVLASRGFFINRIFYIDLAKLLLTILFLFISYLVYRAARKRGLKY